MTYRRESNECELAFIAALERHEGVGTALLEALLEAVAECERIWLVTTNDNLDALRFYQRRGFVLSAWVVPVSTPLCQITITNGGRITANNGDKGTFGGNAKVSKSGSPSGQEEYQDHGLAADINVHSVNILAVVCSADKKSASIYGTATINGSGSYAFKIDVTDNGEPGTNDTYRILLSNGYDSGVHKLVGGNIQIRIG